MPSVIQYPKIRPIDAFPVNTEQGQSICIADPQKIARNPLAISPFAYFIITLMDGERSLAEIQETFKNQFRQLVSMDAIESIVETLDREFYLESDRYREEYRRIRETFHNAPSRPAAHAGLSYESGPDALRTQLGDYFAAAEAEGPAETPPENGRVTLLVAPHIDFRRGGPAFAHAYRELRRRPPSDLYVILGTGHQLRTSLLCATRKPFETPLGPVETDREFIEDFAREAPLDLFEEEFMHRDEHSVEFQTVFLRHILPSDWTGKIAPLLCGSFHAYVQMGVSPRSDRRLADSLDVLKQRIEAHPGTVTVIAGVDMSHVGKRFGHADGIPAVELQRVESEDGDVIGAMKSGEAERFYRSVEANKDRNNVCGLSPVYMALDIASPPPGCLLAYGKAVEEETESVVTFASLAFYE